MEESLGGSHPTTSGTKEGGLHVKLEKGGLTELETPVPDRPKSAVEDMVRVLRDGTPPHVPGEEGMCSVRLMEHIYAAAGVGPQAKERS